MEYDWPLVRAVIDVEAAYARLTQIELCQQAGVERTVLHNMQKGRPVSDTTLRRLESVLGMPREFLLLVAKHDLDGIDQTDATNDLKRLVRAKINEANTETA